MIRIKYIPNLLKDEGREYIELPYQADRILLSYLGETKCPYGNCRVILNGEVITDLSIFLRNEDEITIIPKTGFHAIAAFFELSEFWLIAGTVIDVALTVASLAMGVYSMLAKPRTPSFGNGSGIDETSPTYGWDGIRNTQDVGLPIGIVYGEHRVGGNIINQFIRTDGDKQYLNMLIALSEGEIESIDEVQINQNPSENFNGITVNKRYGTNSQTVLSNFHDTHNLQSLNVNLLKDDDYVHTTVETDITAFELNLTCVGGLYQADSSGTLLSWSVTYKVEYKIHTDGSYTDLGTFTIDALSRTDVRRVFRKEGLTAGQYDIRITKTSDDSSLDPVKQGDLYLKGVDEITQDEPLTYPNTALLGLEALATDQLNGAVPTVTSLVKGRKVNVPDVRLSEGGSPALWEDYYYDDDASAYKTLAGGSTLYWDGSTYVDAYCANPIWCLRDLITNTRYGLGEYITSAMMDASQLLEMAQYCEERVSDGAGGYEKRFRLDVVIDSATRAMDLIIQLTATFRAFAFYSGGAVKLKIDKAETPVQMFGMGNIIKSSFVQNWKSVRENPNLIQVQFIDKDKNYTQDTIAVADEVSLAAGNPMRKRDARLFCTRISQCLREARYSLLVAKYINRTVTLKAGIDAIACQAGDIINVCHDVPQWGFSGRVQTGSTTTKVYFEQTITLDPGKTYYLRIRFADDTQEEKQVITPAGSYNYAEVSSAFSQAPAAFDLYSIGEVNKVVKPFRVVSMRRSGGNEVEITAIEYDADIYDTDTIYLPQNNYSALTIEVPQVENLLLTERLLKLGDGTIENVIDVWFNKPDSGVDVVQYDRCHIYLSDNDGDSWEYRGETSGRHFSIQGNIVDGQTYKVAVASVGFNGKVLPIADSPSESITIIGKSAAPSNVTGFIVRQSRDRLYFGWTAISDVDLSGYEIRQGESWESGYVIASNIKSNNLIRIDIKEADNQKFFIKAIDTTGNYSDTATEAVISIDSVPFTNIIETYSEQTAWSGTKSNTTKVGDNLEISSGQVTGTYTTDEIDIGYLVMGKIGIDSVVTNAAGYMKFDDSLTAEFDDSETLRFSGEDIAGAASFEVRTSEDDITWSDWQTWTPTDYTFRYFQLRMTLTRENTGIDLECSQFDYWVDLPDVDEFGEAEITDAGTGIQVTYTKTFHKVPVVAPQILSGDGRVIVFTSEPDLTDFTAKAYDLSGVAKTGRFSYHIHGV